MKPLQAFLGMTVGVGMMFIVPYLLYVLFFGTCCFKMEITQLFGAAVLFGIIAGISEAIGF